MYGDQCCTIRRAANGYTVELRDPAIEAANRKPKAEYQNPERSFLFTELDAVLAFLKKTLPTVQTKDYSSSFDEALAATADTEADD